MSIPSIPNSVLQYLRRFDLVAVARSRDGRLTITRDPQGAAEAHWLAPRDAGVVLAAARQDHGDVVKAALALGVRLAPHSHVMQRSQEIVDRLGTRIAQAQRAGEVSFINREYKRRRLQAQAEGRPFMPYRAAQARLRKALVGVAAGDPAPIMTRVFGDRLPDPQ
jgi:hypothetical protein